MRKLAQTILVSAILSCAFLTSSSEVMAQSANPRGVELPTWAHSVVRIWFVCGGNIDSGAGVVVSKSGRVVTAAHLGRSCTSGSTQIHIGFVNSPYLPPVRQYIARRVEQHVDNLGNPTAYDLALLQIVNPDTNTLRPAVVSRTLPVPGDEALVVGFSLLPYQWLPGSPEPSLSVLKTYLFSVAATASESSPSRLHYGGGTLAGMSGGPLFDRNGHLIGIHSGRSTANISNLLNENCSNANYQQNKCSGNAIKIDYRDHAGVNRTQVINLSYFDLKALLENYSWATSVWRIPASWLQ